MKFKLLLIILLALPFAMRGYAQKSARAGQLKTEAIELIYKKSWAEAESKLTAALAEEQKQAGADKQFLGEAYGLLGQAYLGKLDYKQSIASFEKMTAYNPKYVTWYDNWLLLVAAYDSLSMADQTITPVTTTGNTELHFTIVDIRNGAKDTIWLTLNGGSNLGLKTGMTGYATKVHNAQLDRSYESIGKIYITKVSPNKAVAYMLAANPSEKDKLVYKGEQAYFSSLSIPGLNEKSTSLFKTLSSLNIIFTDMYRAGMYNHLAIMRNGNENADKAIMYRLLQDIKSSATWLKEEKDKPAAWITPQTGGKFKGLGILDAMEKATVVDVETFIRFVLEFPGKYLGHDWKINETFATWVINNTPMPAKQDYLLSAFMEVPDNEIPTWVNNHGFYIDSIKTLIRTAISTQMDANHLDSADMYIIAANRLHKLVEDKVFESEMLANQGRMIQLKKQAAGNDEAIALFTKAIELNNNNGNAYWFRGNIYAEQERYDAAINDMKTINKLYPYFASAWGNTGWWYLKQFKVKDAEPFVKEAYKLDSTVSAWAVNLGHYHLFTNNGTEARRLYQKTLNNITTESEFMQGPLADFDLFMKSGMFQDVLAREKEWMLNEYNQTFKHYVLADSLYALAKKYKEKKAYTEAVQYYLKSRDAELKAKKPRNLSIHNITTWIGYMLYLNKEYDKSEQYYFEALEKAKKELTASSISNDLDLLSDLYSAWGKKALAESYKAESEAYNLKWEDETETNKTLYIVSVGVDNYDDIKYQYAASDAQTIANEIKAKAKQYTEVVNYTLLNNKATADSINAAVNRVASRAKKGDTFIFYFTGKATSIGHESFLLPANLSMQNIDSSVRLKAISASMVRAWSNSIAASHQLYLVDASAASFPSAFASGAPTPATTKTNFKNLGVIAANFPRIEKNDLKSGMLASSLLNIMKEENATEDKMLTYKRLENHLTSQLSRSNHYLSLESFSHGRDFVLVQYDNAPLNKAKMQSANRLTTRGAEPDMPVEGRKQVSIGKRYGLFIATDNYQDPKWTALKNPVFDARELKKELEDNYGFEIKLLENPTRKEIVSILNEYTMKQFNKNDQLVVLFAGHGFYDASGNEGYLVTKDSRYVDIDFESSYISFTSLVRSIKNFKAEHMLLLADACHAGAICDNSLTRGGEGLYDKLSHERRIENHLENPNRIIITSGRKDQKVYDGIDGKNSPFIASVLQALRSSEAKSGALSYHQLMEYIRQMQKTQATVGRLFASDNDEFLFEYVQKTNTYKSDDNKKTLNGTNKP